MKGTLKNKVFYFTDFKEATTKKIELGSQARVIGYSLGYAVQYRKGSTYWPDTFNSEYFK